nr:ribonuclease H-like domain-containing protein [Tanacetum cinerariifolium]
MMINHQNFSNSRRNFAPTAVLTKSRIVPISTARQSSSRAAAPVSAARHINNVVTKPLGSLQDALKDQGYFNSGCFRHMTENISHLIGIKEHDGGYVAFGGGAKGGKITGKGTTRTGKLDFEDVFFVKDLQFNIFRVSQMCDKNNSVLFTETECFVLSPNFKLDDESKVLLKVTRKNNMHIFDMKNIVPQKDLTYLLAKATNDKSMLWILKSFITKIENLVEKKVKIIRFDNETEFKNRVMNEFCEEKDQLGKFDGKLDEGMFVGYSTTSKAFRVYNIKTRKVEENLHITFLENKPMIAGTNSNDFVGKGASFDVAVNMSLTDINASLTEHNLHQQCKLFSRGNSSTQQWEHFFSAVNMSLTDINASLTEHNLHQQCKLFSRGNSSTQQWEHFFSGPSQDYILMTLWNDNSLFDSSCQASVGHNKDKHVNIADSLNDPLMPDLEDVGIFDDAYDDRDEGVEADYNNLETVLPVRPIPSTRINKDHLKEHIIGEMEPKKVTQALDDESWVEAMREELLQFKLLNVWTLVDLPLGKKRY